MLLSNCDDIQEYLENQIVDYLTHNQFTFDQLKTYITSKAPIPEIQNRCAHFLINNQKQDAVSVKKALEKQAFKKQIAEDEQEAKDIRQEEIQDKKSREHLTRKIKTIHTLIETYESEKNEKHQELMAVVGSKMLNLMGSNAAEKKNSGDKKKKIESLRASIQKIDQKIKEQSIQLKSIRLELRDINNRQAKREELTQQHAQRQQARIGYETTGERILDTLSTARRAQLLKGIQEQHSALDLKFSKNLRDEAEALSFGLFLKILPLQMKHLNLTEAEKDALRICLNWVNKHLQYEQQLITIQDSLKHKKQALSSEITKLHSYSEKSNKLHQNTPELIEGNKNLASQNIELKQALEQQLILRKNLGNASLLCLALTFVFSIPVILAYCGVIPFFIAPVFLFLLVSTPPALLLLATLALGISSLVFNAKAHTSESLFQLNVHTIKINNQQIKKNSDALVNLQKATIPSLKKQMKKDEDLRDNLTTSLQDMQKLSEQALKQAKEIKVVPYSSSQLLTDKLDLQAYSDALDEETDIEESEDAEEISFA